VVRLSLKRILLTLTPALSQWEREACRVSFWSPLLEGEGWGEGEGEGVIVLRSYSFEEF